MKRIFLVLMLSPLSSFAMEDERDALAMPNSYVETMVYPENQQERDAWKEYCALDIACSLGITSKPICHHAHINLLNKAVGKQFEFSDGDFDWVSYTVKCALLKMKGRAAVLKYWVVRDRDQQVKAKSIEIVMGGREHTERLFFHNKDKSCASLITLDLKMTPQGSLGDHIDPVTLGEVVTEFAEGVAELIYPTNRQRPSALTVDPRSL